MDMQSSVGAEEADERLTLASIRLPETTFERADVLCPALEEDTQLRTDVLKGQRITRSSVLRLALELGLERLDSFYGVEPDELTHD